MPRGFRGRVLSPDTPGYDDARTVFNARYDDRRPALILRPADDADVAAAVRHARDTGRPFAVRGGGHNFAGYAAADGAVVLDTRSLDTVTVDPAAGTVTVGAGLPWSAVDAATHPYGLATPGGSVSTVGVAGFTLGTGLGWLGRAYGLAADNLLAATVVTADGTVRSVSATDEPDLFWALRGGCGNFGVVTRLTLRLHPLRTVLAGPLVSGLDDAARVIRAVRDATAAAPDQLSWSAVLTTAPPAFPAPLRGRPVLLLPLCWSGPPAQGERVVAAVRAAAGPVAADLVGTVPYPVFQGSADAAAPPGVHWDVRSEWLSILDDAAVDALVAGIAANRAPLSEVLVRPLGGAVATGPDTAFSYRGAGWLLEVLAGWLPDASPAGGDADRHRAWMTGTWESLRRLSAGGPCVSHLGVGEGAERVRAAYSPAGYDRLVRIKRRYDPDRFFAAAPPLSAELVTEGS